MIIVLNERVLETLLDIGFHLVEEGTVGYLNDLCPKYGYKVVGPKYFTTAQSKKIASSVMNNFVNVEFFTQNDRYLVAYHGKNYDLHSMYTRSPQYLFFIEALRTKAFDLICNDPKWVKFIQEL